MSTQWIVGGGIVIIAVAVTAWMLRGRARARPTPEILQPGKPLPNFTAINEAGDTLPSDVLLGRPAVLLFVRGSWCPFCSKQVANLTHYYKAITDTGARLILVTPKPLDTTRRVADIFGVRFEFWLDESLAIATSLGILHAGGVPGQKRAEFGEDTVWPTSIVVDADGVIRHTELSRFIADRPKPEKLLEMVKKLQQ